MMENIRHSLPKTRTTSNAAPSSPNVNNGVPVKVTRIHLSFLSALTCVPCLSAETPEFRSKLLETATLDAF